MKPQVIHGHLEAAADATPHHIAVVDGERRITYGDLDDLASRIATLLQRLGATQGERVGLYLDKSIEAVAAIYGVLKTGAAYVPLDPAAPPARLAYIAHDCGLSILLTGAEKADAWELLAADGNALCDLVVLNDHAEATLPTMSARVDVHRRAEVDGCEPDVRAGLVGAHDLAYILYTSGSTGNPKGVMLTHDNCLAFVDWAVAELDVGATDRLSSHAPFHFDLSTFDLFAAAEAHATLVLVPAQASVFPIQLARFMADEAITIWYSVPSILSMLTLRGKLAPGSLPALRTVIFAGEVFPTKHLRTLMQLLPDVRFVNLYGPTETNVCTWYDVPPLADDDEAPIPIGRAIDDVDVFDVDGELWVRGRTVMQGYWNDAERTARSLVPHERNGGPDLAYRTGDVVELGDDGLYRFLGRRDNQIKSRGNRIELGDIEAALYSHPDVDECAVLAIPDDIVSNRLRAIVASKAPLVARDLTRFCAERLPRYMIPDAIDVVDTLPKTSTGKIDRQALMRAATTNEDR
ncbi:MAG: hypothetical protein QOH79_2321 [Acidimicrobiaceae bacterium]